MSTFQPRSTRPLPANGQQRRVTPTSGTGTGDDSRLGALQASLNTGPTAQRLAALQRRANASVAHKGAPIQRNIRVKDGATYTAEENLPQILQGNQGLKDKANAAGVYLAGSNSDLTKRAAGQPSEILSPHRHLIGEVHTESEFETAIAKWGWGADRMVEGFQKSTVVPDLQTRENKNLAGVGFASNPLHNAKELENLHAYVLSSLATTRFWLVEVEKHSRGAKSLAERVANKQNVTTNKALFKGFSEAVKKERALAAGEWNGSVKDYVPSYKAAATERLKTNRGLGITGSALLHDMATAMTATWDKLNRNMAILTGDVYSFTDSWATTKDKFAAREANTKNFIAKAIDVWAGHLRALTKAEATLLTGDTSHDDTIDDGWDEATNTTKYKEALIAGGNAREIFMVNNINSGLNVPGIVRIGELHVERLDGQITDGAYHDSYDDFVAATKIS